METTSLRSPDGIDVLLGVDARRTEHERRHLLARELIAARVQVPHRDIHLRREEPGSFGYHTHLYATLTDDPLPFVIKAASREDVTVVAVADLGVPLGLDVRSAVSLPSELAEIRRHAHLLPDADENEFRQHWTRVCAVREADGRGARVHPEHVRLDPPSSTGWVPDRRIHYRLEDLSSNGWVVTLAYGAGPR